MKSRHSLLLCIVWCHAGAMTTVLAAPVLIRGRATDPDRAPLAGVRVVLPAVVRQSFGAARGPTDVSIARTDDAGAFALRLPEAVPETARRVRVFAIQPGVGLGCAVWDRHHPERELDIVVWPLRVITGTVKCPDGDPVAGARVRLSSLSFRPTHTAEHRHVQAPARIDIGDAETRTDAHGRFALRALPPAVEGWLDLLVDAAPHAWWAGRFDLVDAREYVDIELGEPARIEGRATFEDSGAPAAGVTVRCEAGMFARRGTAVHAATVTDETGRYVVARVPESDYTEVAVHAPDAEGWLAEEHVALRTEAGHTTSGIDFVLSRGVLVRGTMTDTDGNPVKDVVVRASGEGVHRSAVTAADGSYAVRCLPGDVSVSASGLPRGYVRLKHDGNPAPRGHAPDAYDRKNLTLGAAEGPTAVDLVIGRGITLRGRAVDPAGKPVVGAEVTGAAERWYPASAETDETGGFALEGVPSGIELWLRLVHRGAALGASVRLDEEANLREPLVVKLAPFGTAVGKVQTPDGTPVAGELVHYEPSRKDGRGPALSTVTDDRGEYRFSAPAGSYVMGVGRDYRRRGQAEVEIKPGRGTTVDDITWVAPRKIRVAGRVVDPEAQPIPGLFLRVQTCRETFEKRTDRTGRFALDRIWIAEGMSTLISAVDTERNLAAVCKIDPDAAADVTFELAPAAVLTGRAVDDDGAPVAGAELRLYDEKGLSRDQSLEASADGTFRFSGVLPGREYTIYACAPGHLNQGTEPISVSTSRTVDVPDIVFVRADQFVEGMVTDHGGRPLPGVDVHCRNDDVASENGRTDATGKFRVDGLPRGALDIDFYKDGYEFEQRRGIPSGRTGLSVVMWPEDREPPAKLAQPDKPAPELAGVDWASPETTGLEALIGKPLVLCFWSIHSRHAVRDAAALRQLQRDHADVGLTVVTVHDASATLGELHEFAAQHELPFHLARARPGEADGWMSKAFTAYGVRAVPRAFLIDAQGVLRAEGTIADIAKAAAELLR